MLNYGGFDTDDDFDPDLHDAGGMFVTTRPGTSFFDSVTSFEIARGGRLYAVILGVLPGRRQRRPGELGGARDDRRRHRRRDGPGRGAQHVFVTLEHTDSRGGPKLVERCDLR